jgi:DNA helicase IV
LLEGSSVKGSGREAPLLVAKPEQPHPDFLDEQEFLLHAYRALQAMRESPGLSGDAGGDPKASAALRKEQERFLDRLEHPDTVCFGRIDQADGDHHYIGPRGVFDAGGTPIVINWSAPAAEPFYEATPDDPVGLVLRRRFRTRRETLLGISDETFGAAEEPTIIDVLLEELGQERTAEMREIASTIQQDQYRIISRPLDATTVVQGGPGTGKTAVGLHRAAFLLYRHRQDLVASRVLIVGPNPLFMRYIAYVLPSLGETTADQLAIEALGPVSPVRRDDELVGRVKGDERMAEVLRRAVVDRVRAPDEDVRFSANNVRFTVEASAIAELVDGFDARSQSYVAARDRFRAAFERIVSDRYVSEVTRRAASPAAPSVNVRALREFERAVDRIWPAITAAELVRQLLASEERSERAATDMLTIAERRLLYRPPVERLDQVRWSVDDVPLVDEVQSLLEPTARRYGHVVLDEAQDLTPMQLRMVGRRIRAGSVTVLGDLAQATGLWTHENWESITDRLGLEDAPVEELTLAYRVPTEIMALALPVLRLTAPSIEPPKAFRPGHERPSFVAVSEASLVEWAVSQAVEAHGEGGVAAIISPHKYLPGLREELGRQHVEFGDAERDELVPTIELLDPVSAKGLEFDHVILVEPAAIVREGGEKRGYRELYVALTRAMRSLRCVHSEPLPWPLDEHVEEPDGLVETLMPPVAPQSETPSNGATASELSIGEALVLARLRGLDVTQALARALIVLARGGSESAAANAVLDVAAVAGSDLDLVLASAARGRNDRKDGGE